MPRSAIDIPPRAPELTIDDVIKELAGVAVLPPTAACVGVEAVLALLAMVGDAAAPFVWSGSTAPICGCGGDDAADGAVVAAAEGVAGRGGAIAPPLTRGVGKDPDLRALDRRDIANELSNLRSTPNKNPEGMGVPALFAWLQRKYPSIVRYAKEEVRNA
jgi:hypothetical protein